MTALTDDGGTVVERYAYTPYGEATVLDADFSADADGVSDIANEYLYTGRRLDPETGLQLNRNRFYASHLGRWVNRDPIGYDGATLNLYEYLNGMPITELDPNGKGPCGYPHNNQGGNQNKGCCNGQTYDKRTQCCEDGNVVGKVSIWICSFWFHYEYFVCLIFLREVMSIIVVVRKGNSAAIASDFQTTYGSMTVPGEMRRYPRKIHLINEAYLGIIGSIAHHNVMLSLASSKPDLFKFANGDEIAATLRKIYPILRDEYYLLSSEDDNDQEYESSQMSGLILSKGGIFSFSSYREVSEYEAFWAAGSGIEYGLGALEATYNSMQNAKAIAETAVRAACKFDSASGLPLESYEIELAGEEVV
ncbi:MAG: hypothetical protein KDA57_21915 [Planctomycetales bacterium]|nr:hypothetical protein [Planctomycetales bacterium]